MSKVYTFAQFIFEAKKQSMKPESPKSKKKAAPVKKKAGKKMDQDGDGDSDFADAKIAQYTAGGIDKAKAMSMSRKFNKSGVNEMFSFGKKEDGKNPFAKVKKGQTIKYKGEDCEVLEVGEYSITVKCEDGKEKKINAKMFKDSGKTK
jgi:DNA polymerase I-like protein with 3'-5' exonuclease and polymerase domains